MNSAGYKEPGTNALPEGILRNNPYEKCHKVGWMEM